MYSFNTKNRNINFHVQKEYHTAKGKTIKTNFSVGNVLPKRRRKNLPISGGKYRRRMSLFLK